MFARSLLACCLFAAVPVAAHATSGSSIVTHYAPAPVEAEPEISSRAFVWTPRDGATDAQAFIMVVDAEGTRRAQPSRVEVLDDFTGYAASLGYAVRPVRAEDFRTSHPVVHVRQYIDPRRPDRLADIELDFRMRDHQAIVAFWVELVIVAHEAGTTVPTAFQDRFIAAVM